ncbi:hypothetical protein B0T25DRAFT_537327 [Lasiosphaeria hispida]|uniref:Zn(2)-C6 fungal-type domain-containing protein n=1 Tax=Lasiosphaeria hispida TaxID=260671 RepID=A0AAJ0MFH3_9PEZI|nr:hypothetical protein B0T25DRAFT_537327 [Lasiosphaeria hispida]
MDIGWNGAEPQTTNQLYFCPTCGKPFNQESTHTRHVQYCRRRTARKRASRPKACQSCRATKTKCDFREPCSRCVTNQTPCSYPVRNGPILPLGTRSGNSAASSLDITGYSPVVTPSIATSCSNGADTPSQSSTNERQVPGGSHINSAPDPEFTISASPQDGYAAIISDNLSQPPNVAPNDQTGQSHQDTNPTPASDVACLLLPHQSSPSVFSMFALPATDAFEVGQTSNWGSSVMDLELWSRRYISHPSRQLIVSILRTFPRMLIQPKAPPPIVHHLSCGYGYNPDGQRRLEVNHGDDGQAVPSRPLAACMSIAQIFASQIPNSRTFLWTMVDYETYRIKDEMNNFSQYERLASIQALVMYIIMRFADSGTQYLAANGEIIRTLRKLAESFAQNCSGPFSPSHTRPSRPSWEEWVYEETRRRVVIVCFLITLIVGGEVCNLILDPYSIPLPSDKALWEAKSLGAWEEAYDASLAARGADHQQRFDTLGDLVAAKHGGGRSAVMSTGCGGDGVGGALDDWHAGLDGVGMMLAIVLAGL